MPRRRKGERVRGPYQRRGRPGWQVEVVGPDGAGRYRTFARREDAEVYADECRAALVSTDLTVAQALEQYELHLREKGNRPTSIARTLWGLGHVLGPVLASPLELLSEAKLRRGYKAMADRYAVDSHRNALAELKTFLRWCVAQRWLARNYAEDIAGLGSRRKRAQEDQPTIDEARRWRRKAHELARTEAGAVAALCALILGMRASEIVSRQVRDVDDEGRLLWIRRSKTRKGRRVLEVPAELRGYLVELSEGRSADELLFGAHWRDWPRLWVQRICREAGVPVTHAHAMRGMAATLVIEAGAHAVSGFLGQEDERTTHGYARPGAAQVAQRRRLLGVLDGGESSAKPRRRNRPPSK